MTRNNKDIFKKILQEILTLAVPSVPNVQKVLHKNPLVEGVIAKKSILIEAFNTMLEAKEWDLAVEEIKKIRLAIQMKNTRTISGVTPVTVLTKPFPCPGKCIFCPSDVRMPKSYVSSEPGAQRAEHNKFDPYFQTYNRLCAYGSIGHPTDKVELIILGGTWSFYPKDYQIWFIKRCFDAMNDFNSDDFAMKDPSNAMPYLDENIMLGKDRYNKVVSKNQRQVITEKATWEDLFESHRINENAYTRCVGLVVETRPEYVTEEEMIHIRKLGATKVQIGIQSLDDNVLELNKRGHLVEDTKRAFALLRKYGFKIHGHWMANLYGSTPDKDIEDYKKVFNKEFCPDELKIYPCSLVETAELMDYYHKGLWHPYTDEELSKVLVEVFRNTPRYCRLTRVIRDIPSHEIVVGNKKTNFRQIVEEEVKKQGIHPVEIRAREIRGKTVNLEDLHLSQYEYETTTSKELFIEYVTNEDELAGFLRLSLLKDSKHSMIREIHVYGQSIQIGGKEEGKAQHIGLGKNLIELAKNISKENKYEEMYVISSIGTREYYRKRGFDAFDKDMLYQVMPL
jgi:elongator complex protein 3